MQQGVLKSAFEWWGAHQTRFNVQLYTAAGLALLLSIALPYILSLKHPCAEYAEIDTAVNILMFIFIIGLSNGVYLLLPLSEAVLPNRYLPGFRSISKTMLTVLSIAGFLILCFKPFYPSLFIDPELLCD